MKVGFLMGKNLYFYFFHNINKVINDIDNYEHVCRKENNNKLEFDIEYLRKEINRVDNKINLYYKISAIKFIIFKKINLLVIITEKYNYIKDFCSANELKKVNLLSNTLFYNIFNEKFSENLMKLNISTTNVEALIDNIEMVGNNLYNSDVFYNLNDYLLDKETKIKCYSFQVKKYSIVVNISSTNRMEVRGRDIKEEKIMKFLEEFIGYLDFGWRNL